MGARREAAEYATRLAAAQAFSTAAEGHAKTEALALQLSEVKQRLCRTEAEAAVAVHQAEVAAKRRLEKEEGKITERVQRRAEELFEQKAAKMRHKYEQKLVGMCRQLAERETYEHRLKSLLQDEVDILHEYNRDLDYQGQRLRAFESDVAQNAATDNMRIVEDVERRIMKNIRHKYFGRPR